MDLPVHAQAVYTKLPFPPPRQPGNEISTTYAYLDPEQGRGQWGEHATWSYTSLPREAVNLDS